MARKAKKTARKPAITQRVGEDRPPISTLALGEETVWTTLMLGEEGPTHFYGEHPTHLLGEHPTTLVFPGEEHPHPTTLVPGEEGPGGGPTTLAVGEEGPHPTTLVVGEEGPTTKRIGEEGPITTQMVGEDKPKAKRKTAKRKR